ncbi:MAG TPA: phosphatase PAP2 family protein [Terriglobia bacterium]|nr:phosphatase PAP2 family protein [Terriglobia bacterium]
MPNLLQDQKNIWFFPAGVVRGRHWKPVLAFVTATVGLVTLDPLEAPYFRSTSSYHTLNQVFSTRNTGIGLAAVPLTFYAVSLLRHNTYDQQSVLFAGEAVLDSTLVEAAMKASFRRVRPAEVPKGANFWDTFTEARGGLFSGSASFPSGHTITAFSIATVFANRYSRHRWVPWVAYGLATAVGFSRVTLQAHFVSDVFAGAVLGYSISHYVVLQR